MTRHANLATPAARSKLKLRAAPHYASPLAPGRRSATAACAAQAHGSYAVISAKSGTLLRRSPSPTTSGRRRRPELP